MPQTPPCVACGEPLEGWEGHSCYKCVQGLAEQRDDLFDEVMKLRYENKILKEGLPIEKAKELDEVLIIGWDSSSTDGVFWQEAIGHVEGTYLDAAIATWTKVPTSDGTYRYEWFDENNGVIYKNPKAFFTPPVLPSTETKEGD